MCSAFYLINEFHISIAPYIVFTYDVIFYWQRTRGFPQIFTEVKLIIFPPKLSNKVQINSSNILISTFRVCVHLNFNKRSWFSNLPNGMHIIFGKLYIKFKIKLSCSIYIWPNDCSNIPNTWLSYWLW